VVIFLDLLQEGRVDRNRVGRQSHDMILLTAETPQTNGKPT